MAKFKLRPELIPTFETRKVIVGGIMKMKVPTKANRITGEKCYEVAFNPTTHCLQTSNDYTAAVLRKRTSPRIKVGGSWLLDDPANPWFIELPDTDPMPGLVVEGETEVLTRKDRKLILKHHKRARVNLPSDFTPANAAGHLAAAQTFFKSNPR